MPRVFALIAIAAALAGCSMGHTKYGCPAPGGVSCLSAEDVYRATDNRDRIEGRARNKKEAKALAEARAGRDATLEALGIGGENSAREIGDASPWPVAYTRVHPDEPIPVRSPAQVIRIWISPWEDTTGNLHLAGHVFSEIEPRRWMIGAAKPSQAPTLTPLQLAPSTNPSSASSTTPAAPASSSTAASVKSPFAKTNGAAPAPSTKKSP